MWPVRRVGQSDLEQLRPVFAGDEQAITRAIVGDAVRDVVRAARRCRLTQAGQVDPSVYDARRRVDPRDQLGLPDVGQNLPLYPFEFVKIGDGAIAVAHGDGPLLAHRQRIEKPQPSGSVAQDDAAAVTRHPPALAGIHERTLGLETRERHTKPDTGAPGNAADFVVPVDDALAEQVFRDRDLPNDDAVAQPDPSDCRAPLEPGALEQIAIAVEQPFGEGVGVVRVAVDDPVAAERGFRCVGRRTDRQRGDSKDNEPLHPQHILFRSNLVDGHHCTLARFGADGKAATGSQEWGKQEPSRLRQFLTG